MSDVALTAMLALGGCGGGGSSPGAVAPKQLSPAAELGERIFCDASLLASGAMSCETCHSPNHAHAQPTTLAVPLGGAGLNVPGFRNAPSLRYLNLTPPFFFDREGTPTGGFNRDGRAQSLMEQAQRPFLAAHEMANATAASVIDKLKLATYIGTFRPVFGADILRTPDVAFERVLFALSQYQKENPDFHAFDSKYDYFLAGKVVLSDPELRGLALFNSPAKGNCAACHPNARGSNGSPPLFTDFTYDNIGVPRNPDIPANADPAYFDLGLCGPFRTDLASRNDLCGAFKVPTLRNVALTAPYFHNGRFATLRLALQFYVRRDTNPEEWYPLGPGGVPRKFDDLPAQQHANVNLTEAPYHRVPGDARAVSEREIDDLIAFLDTSDRRFQTMSCRAGFSNPTQFTGTSP